MNNKATRSVIRAIARLTRIDPVVATRSKRHNPILDSEIHIEEELINLQESIDSLATAGDTLKEYPKVYAYVSREKRAITKHCIGLVVRMLHGRTLPRPYTRDDIEYALRRLVQLVVFEARRAGKRIDDDQMALFRPFLTVRQRVVLRDWGMDLVLEVTQVRRAGLLMAKLQSLRAH